MQFKVKLLSFNEPASDSSIIRREVVEAYMATPEYKNAIMSRSLLGTMSHYPRSSSNVKNLSPGISKTVGKDDLLIIVGEAAPTHYITGLECCDDGWLYATAEVLDERNFDSHAADNIKRLKGLLKSGCLIGVSAVINGYWNNNSGTGGDVLEKMVSLKSFDITLCPSWKKAQVVSVKDDDGNVIASVDDRLFSENSDVKYEGFKVKTFSTDGLDQAKSSKVNGKFTVLKVKEFSANTPGFLLSEETQESVVSTPTNSNTTKSFSVATLKERVRYASKFSPRVRFRRLFLEYKQLVKMSGGADKIDPETMKVMKSLFVSDINQIMTTLTPDIMAGKQINTLIGASSLGKSVRQFAQKLQLPYRLAFQEMQKTGKITPMRFEKIKLAYSEFIQSMVGEVFGNNPIPEGLEEDLAKEEGGNK